MQGVNGGYSTCGVFFYGVLGRVGTAAPFDVLRELVTRRAPMVPDPTTTDPVTGNVHGILRRVLVVTNKAIQPMP